MESADKSLARLLDGNSRYVRGEGSSLSGVNPSLRGELAGGQQPCAVVLACADARVVPEAIFDQGLGDLFVVRVAGNIATPTQIGSIELAAEAFRTRLIVVLGHTGCAAVRAALDAEQPDSPHLRVVVDEVRRALAGARDGTGELTSLEAVRANVVATVRRLCAESRVLGALARDAGLRIVGAVYSLETGEVELLDAPSAG